MSRGALRLFHRLSFFGHFLVTAEITEWLLGLPPFLLIDQVSCDYPQLQPQMTLILVESQWFQYLFQCPQRLQLSPRAAVCSLLPCRFFPILKNRLLLRVLNL